MKRIAAVLGTTMPALLVLLGAAGTAHADGSNPPMAACGGGYAGPALATHLHYRPVTWNVGAGPDDGSLGIDAPRSWSFVRTPQGEGRFHGSGGHDVLSLAGLTSTDTPADLMSAQVRELAGTPGLKVIGQHTKVLDGQRWSTLAYRWSDMGEPRSVKERWIAYGTASSDRASVVVTVAGRTIDGTGLDALLEHVSPTVQAAG